MKRMELAVACGAGLAALLSTSTSTWAYCCSISTSHSHGGITRSSTIMTVSGEMLSDFTAAPTAQSNIGTFDINIRPNSTLASNAAALAAFNRAAANWERFIADPVTINIDAGLAPQGPGVIASAGSVQLQASYASTFRPALTSDASNEADDAIVNSLPAGTATNPLVFTLPAGFTQSTNVVGNKATLKALGFTGLDTQFGDSDATINFSDTFAFDFDNSNGVSSGTLDFETVATHEIGHALGFISSADVVDQNASGTVAGHLLDLFRFANNTSQDPSNPAEFNQFARNLVPGTDAIFDDTGTEYRLSTGVAKGDGRQASHWKDNDLTGVLIGVMDPTLGNGQQFSITNADLRAMDLIGYEINLIPEPATLAALALGTTLLLRRQRKA